MKFERVGIFTKHQVGVVCNTAREVYDYIKPRVNEVYLDKPLAKKLKITDRKKFLNTKEMDVDLLIAIGGDGTILTAEKLASWKRIPILGVKCGALGFLAEIDGDFKPYFNKLFKGQFRVEERTKLDVKLNGEDVGEVLNDVVVASAIPGKIQRFSIDIHGQKIEEIRADGIIVATPTGSTAYGLSAGGPIIDPTLDAYEIVPNTPFKLSSRAFLVPADTITEIRVLSTRRDAVLVLDGETGPKMTYNDKLEVTTSYNKSYFIKFSQDFFPKVLDKLI